MDEWPGDDEDFNLVLNDTALHLLDAPQQQPTKNDECAGFDTSVGNTWLYPSNLPLRTYQQSIVNSALYRNTLVVLPTGLGKTFIAAVVMYNFYRWYPQAKLLFMAPTRPLVSQQIAACQKIMPFSAEDTVELTGRLPRAKRAELWRSKRVFFATPQVVQSDMLDTGDGLQFPYDSIKLLVVDEAHRAKGRYAYTQVTESIMARNRHFRMLALSATPGRTIDDVAAVCRNLYISHLEVRWDNSIDVQQYTHQRSLRKIVVPLKDSIKEPRARLLQIIDPYLRELVAADVLKSARGNFSRNSLLFDQHRFRERAANGERHPEHSTVTSNFSMCISLYHALELLERHGLRVFVNHFDADDKGFEKFVLRDAAVRQLVEHTRQQLGGNPLDVSTRPMTNGVVPPMPSKLDFGHPKYEHARLVMQQHFEEHPDSRAIVFCEYRESVMLIQRLLLQHRPMVRPRCFVGQSGNGGGICALTQKEQLQIMSDFRAGVCNVLVATSIGEEGLDVGEVELIVCFDICSSNPTRFVQRIGRTGRQKRGHVVMLVSEGKEEQLLKEVLANKDQTNRKMLQSVILKRSLYEHSSRLVPAQFNPKCEQRFMEPSKTPVKAEKTPPKSKTRKPAKELASKGQDLRKFFKQSQDRFLKGEPAYKMSEASQNMLQQQVARHSVVKSFLVDTQPLTLPISTDSHSNNCNTVAASSTVSSSQEETQRMRKLTRLLQASKPLVSESQRSQDLVAQLQDKQVPQSLKLYLLQRNAQFVREIHARMQQQMAQALPEARLNSRQQRTRRIYELVQQVCQGQLEQLLQPVDACAELTLKDLQQPSDAKLQEQFDADCLEIFKDLPERGLCADNYELLHQKLEQLELLQLEQTMKDQLDDDITNIYEQWSEQENFGHEASVATEQQNDSVCQSQWQDFVQHKIEIQHSSTPLQKKQLQQEPDVVDTPKAVTNQLSLNLNRLNCLMNVASMPLKALAEDSLLNALDENISAFDQLTEPKIECKVELPMTSTEAVAADMSTPDVIDLDLNDFLEPLPEEELLAQLTAKENQLPDRAGATTPRINSPDLFAEDSTSPLKPTPATVTAKTLAAKLADKHPSRQAAFSPKRENSSAAASLVKSPSIFENYLRGMRGRGQRARAARRLQSMSSAAEQPKAQLNLEEEDSPIVRRRPAKRKIYDTSDEQEEEADQKTTPELIAQLIDEDSYEQVPATQLLEITPPRRSRQKRARFNEFVIQEAEQSGSEHEEDEDAERTIGCYLKDSVIVSSDDEDQHNDTNAHAMYLQAIRSPIRRPGGFKIPAPRAYNNESIYSQPMEAEPSQYLPCSFICDETVAQDSRDITECPLERAERILKERRRQRRREAVEPAVPKSKRRRVHTISDSSDDEDVIFA